MRVEHITPFVESAQRVLGSTLGSEVRAGKLRLAPTPALFKGVAALVGLTGEVEGRVIFDMAMETALKIASAMNGETFTTLSPLAQDSIAELASMMIGNAVTALNDRGVKLKLTPTTLFVGENMTASTTTLETLVIPLSTVHGEVMVDVAVRTT